MKKNIFNFFIRVKVIHLRSIAYKMYNTNKKYFSFSSSVFVEGTTSIITFASTMTLLGY
ncbi:MAG: hypothetical protein IIC74_11075 [Bacteroidetes bacterium]|nr:hypothetical protein [Bacteroidota bacterium]